MRALLCIALVSIGCGFDRQGILPGDSDPGRDDSPGTDAGVAADARPDAAVIDAVSPPACWTDPQYNRNFGGHKYRFEPDEEVRGYQAYAACLADGAYLVAIDSDSEDDFIHNAGEYDRLYIGAFDRPNEGNFRWLTGDTDFWVGGLDGSSQNGAYANWSSGEPNDANVSGEDCSEKREDRDGAWNDQECDSDDDDSHHGYVCECQQDLDFTTPSWLGSLQ